MCKQFLMTPSSSASNEQATHLGSYWVKPWKKRWRMMSWIDRRLGAALGEAEIRRYRKYSEAKAKIPKDLPPAEYEAEIERLAKKYKI